MTEKEIISETNIDTSTLQGKMSKPRRIFSRIKRRLLKHIWIWRLLILVSISAVVVLISLLLVKPFKNTGLYYYAHLAKVFLTTPIGQIKSQDNRTNILILGKGGLGHEAPDLTDSMMLVSVNHLDSSLTLVSFPRDIWIPELGSKLNSVYYWGNKKQQDGGLILAKSVIEEISGAHVDYALVADFSAFKKIIDVLDGVNVDVENSFADPRYPIAGKENDLCGGDPEYNCRYETIKFEKGNRFMDGETALKFVRSRYAEGDEGTDLARAARQQKIIEAIKQKTLSRETLLSPKKIFQLKDVILGSIETDMSPEAAAILGRRVMAKVNPKTHVLSEEFLEVAPRSEKYQNLYVFIPKEVDNKSQSGRSWNKVHDWFKCILETDKCSKQ